MTAYNAYSDIVKLKHEIVCLKEEINNLKQPGVPINVTGSNDYSLNEVRALNVAILPSYIRLKDLGGYFLLDASDNSTPDNTGTCIVTNTNKRYKRVMFGENKVNPYMFGAKGTGMNDDYQALQKWFNTTNYLLELPAGTYKCSGELVRTDKGAVSIIGSGHGISTIDFFNDTNGLNITNSIGGLFNGGITIRNISIKSSGTKTNKEAIFIQGLHNAGIFKHFLSDLYISGNVVNQEWSAGIHTHNTSRIDYSHISVLGATLTTTDGILITNSDGYPCVEHSITDGSLLTLKTGIHCIGTGAPGIEGVLISKCQIVANQRGVVGVSNGYGAPHFSISDTHINTMGGGENIYLKNFLQVELGKLVLYCTNNPEVSIPAQAVLLENPIGVTADITVVTQSNIPNAVSIIGSGGAVNLDLFHTCSWNGTNSLSVANTFTQGVSHAIERIWDGTVNNAWDNTVGNPVVGNIGACYQKLEIATIAGNPNNNNVLQFKTSNYRYNSVSVPASNYLGTIAVTGSQDIDLNEVNSVIIYGSAPTVLRLVKGNAIPNKLLYVFRGDANANADVTFISEEGSQRKFKNAHNEYLDTYVLSKTIGKQCALFLITNTHNMLLFDGTVDDAIPYRSMREMNVANSTITLQPSDHGNSILISTTGCSIIVPKDVLRVDFMVKIRMNNQPSGTFVTLIPETGTFINYDSGITKVAATDSKFGVAELYCISSNWFGLSGDVI